MEGCNIYQLQPEFVICEKMLGSNNKKPAICQTDLRITVKPGPSIPPNIGVPLESRDFIASLTQVRVSTRVPSSTDNTLGVQFAGYSHRMEVANGTDGKPVYTIILAVEFHEMRVSKNADFRDCETNGLPLIFTGIVQIHFPQK